MPQSDFLQFAHLIAHPQVNRLNKILTAKRLDMEDVSSQAAGFVLPDMENKPETSEKKISDADAGAGWRDARRATAALCPCSRQ